MAERAALVYAVHICPRCSVQCDPDLNWGCKHVIGWPSSGVEPLRVEVEIPSQAAPRSDDLPDRTLEVACAAWDEGLDHRRQAEATLAAVMDPALGAARLVVAGSIDRAAAEAPVACPHGDETCPCPERIAEAAARVVYAEAACESDDEVATFVPHARRVVAATMDPSLGAERLVVAGAHERDLVERICAWLDADATNAREWGDEETGHTLARIADHLRLEGIPGSTT